MIRQASVERDERVLGALGSWNVLSSTCMGVQMAVASGIQGFVICLGSVKPWLNPWVNPCFNPDFSPRFKVSIDTAILH